MSPQRVRSHDTTRQEVADSVLSAQEQYHQDLSHLPYLTLTPQQERTFIEQARQGDTEARSALIASCLRYVKHVAWKYTAISRAYGHTAIEYLDVIQEGNLALLTRFQAALVSPNPLGYLRKVASGAIITYCQRFASSIRPTCNHGKFAPYYTVMSLDAPATPESDLTLGEVLSEALPAPEVVPTDEPDYATLYQAIERLSDQQRELILRHYGIEHEPQSLYEINLEWRRARGKAVPHPSREPNRCYQVRKRALVKLRRHLEGVESYVSRNH